MMSTPLWLKLIRRTSKSVAWAAGVVLFVIQLIGTWYVGPSDLWWIPLLLVVVAHLCFSCHNVAALSILGDIVDYGRLKFHKDRAGTYFAVNTLIFKVGLGVGGGLSIGIAGMFGFSPSHAMNASGAIFGLKLGFIIVPICLAFLGLLFIVRTPIDRRRHHIIQRRVESRLIKSESRWSRRSLHVPFQIREQVDVAK
jgi:Na+/melibiose symporter-like transporter